MLHPNSFLKGYLRVITKILAHCLQCDPWQIPLGDLILQLNLTRKDPQFHYLLKHHSREFKFFLYERFKGADANPQQLQSIMSNRLGRHFEWHRAHDCANYLTDIQSGRYDSKFLNRLRQQLGDDFFDKPLPMQIEHLNSQRGDEAFNLFLIRDNPQLMRHFLLRLFAEAPDNRASFFALMEHRYGDRIFTEFAAFARINAVSADQVWVAFCDKLGPYRVPESPVQHGLMQTSTSLATLPMPGGPGR